MSDRFSRVLPILLAAALAGCSEPDGGSGPEPGGGPDAAPEPETATDTAAGSSESSDDTAAAASFERGAAPEDARVYIISPEDGEVVSNPVRIVFGLEGMGVAPAGVDQPDTGHHHLLVDTDPPPFTAPIPADDQHIHFGLGQTETELTLPPGEHTLQLLLGDALHVPHDPAVLSEPITIQVE